VSAIPAHAESRLVVAHRIAVGTALPVHDPQRVPHRQLPPAVPQAFGERERFLVMAYYHVRRDWQLSFGPRHSLDGLGLASLVRHRALHLAHALPRVPGVLMPPEALVNRREAPPHQGA